MSAMFHDLVDAAHAAGFGSASEAIKFAGKARAEIVRLQANEKAQMDGALALLAADKNLRDEIERLRVLVRSAYAEGFSEGINEHTKFRGGKPWEDSRVRRALEGK